MKFTTGDDLTKNGEFKNTFCKLGHFINVNKFCFVMERFSQQKRMSKFTPTNLPWKNTPAFYQSYGQSVPNPTKRLIAALFAT